jgi:hypothetical protein
MAKDNTCLFHSVCYGLKLGFSGHILRQKLYDFLMLNKTIYENIKNYFGNQEHKEYAVAMKHKDFWGGPPELKLMSVKYQCNFYVYIVTKIASDEPFADSMYTRIASYEYTDRVNSEDTVHLLLENDSHYCVLDDTIMMDASSIPPKELKRTRKHINGSDKGIKRAYDQLSVIIIEYKSMLF